MLVFPNCKINIGLRITAKRPDGFHDLETIFFPVPWCDALEIIESDRTEITMSGIEIPGDPAGNLCIKAWHLLKTDFPGLPAVEIHLHKTIPAGAGLGGGSSNGAFMLKALNTKFNLRLSQQRLLEYALRLGSDCPFFILNKPVVARGRGENMEPVPLNLSGYSLVLANPGIHVSTGWAFAQLSPAYPEIPVESLSALPVSKWAKAGMKNDFESPVFSHYPAIAAVQKTLLDRGAVFAAMSGTGSTCFGLFTEPPAFSENDFPANTIVKKIAL